MNQADFETSLAKIYDQGCVPPRIISFSRLLYRWNSYANLIAKRNFFATALRLFDESATALKLANPTIKTVADIGAGNGILGITFAILHDCTKCCLVEPNRKKCDFLANAVAELNIGNAVVINDSWENFFTNASQRLDMILIRALNPQHIIASPLTRNTMSDHGLILYFGTLQSQPPTHTNPAIQIHDIETRFHGVSRISVCTP